MPAITNKQRQLTQLFTALKKGHDVPSDEERPVLDQFLYGICREGATRDQADAFANLREQFFDWNELRVSSTREVEESLTDLPESEPRAERLVNFLQEVFEKDFSFDLEGLRKKGLKEAAKELAKYQAANDYVVAWVIQHSLGGHAIPLDLPTVRTARRLGLIDCDADDMEAARASLEHLVPKAKGPLFCDLISQLAGEVCWEDEPQCGSCPLAGDCPSAVEQETPSRTVGVGGRTGRVKPR